MKSFTNENNHSLKKGKYKILNKCGVKIVKINVKSVLIFFDWWLSLISSKTALLTKSITLKERNIKFLAKHGTHIAHSEHYSKPV